MSNQTTIGRIVQYTLSEQDAQEVNRRRVPRRPDSDEGAQFHVGNSACAGDVFPMMICCVWVPEMVNGQVFLDGNDTLWVTSRHEGDEPGQWRWPVREEA